MTTESPESLQPFLELLAWLGGPFSCEMIAESIGLEDDVCRRQLEVAERFGLVEVVGENYQLSALGYSFCACDDPAEAHALLGSGSQDRA
jgi:predicted transcriptional regulator